MLPYPDRIPLAITPTPLEPLAKLSKRYGVELLIKRDDLTSAPLTGNKVRKLEFLLADAQAKRADTVITCGGEQSNHCRATAIAARRLGMDSVLILRTDAPHSPPRPEGNVLLDKLVGAEIKWVSRDDYALRAQVFVKVADALRARGKEPYLIPEGGSNPLGAWGYVRCVEELARDLPPGKTTIVYATGSGGTGAGLILGIKLLGLDWRAVGVNVCDDRDYFLKVIGGLVEGANQRFDLGLALGPRWREEIEIVDGYVGRGYALSKPEELRLIVEVGRTEGILLDPVYGGKAFYGLATELTRDKRRFGERIVFVHTGGIFGLFPKAHELEKVL